VCYQILIALCVALSGHCFAQQFPFMGPRANGLAYASSCLQDEWATFNNPAGTARIKNPIIATSADAFPAFKPFNRTALTIASPLLGGGVNVGVFRFGDDLFHHQVVSASYANKLGLAALGISIQYHQFNAEGVGRKSVPSFSAGGIAELLPWLTVGAHIVNITQPTIADEETLPTLLVFGAHLKASEKVLAVVEIEKDVVESPLLKAGFEYKPFEKICFRTGFHPDPSAVFGGFSFKLKTISVDYACSHRPNFGTRHHAGISYSLKAKK
jgi:hypothetical protein